MAEELGVKIEKVGDTSAARDKILISMVVKLPDMKGILEPDARTLERLNKECSLGHNVLYTDGHIRIKTIHDTMFKNLNENMEAFLESRTKILESYLVYGTEEVGMGSDRKKREILPIIFGGIYLAIGGLTEYQIFSINQRVSKNNKAIEEMKSRVNRVEEEITILDEKVIRIHY